MKQPTVSVALDVSPEEYYQAPAEHARRLYRAYLQQLGEPAVA